MTDIHKAMVAIIIAALTVTTTTLVLYPHSIEVEIEGEGTVTPSDGSIRFYQDMEFSLEPATGWYVDEVTLNGKDVKVVDGKIIVSASALDFSTMRLKVTFVQGSPEDVRSLTVESNEGGSTDPHGTVEYAKGTIVSVSIVPDEGYGISGITVDGKDIEIVEELSIEMNSDHVVNVVFAPLQTYTITASAGSGGSISPSGPVKVRAGEDITFTAKANADYSVSYLLVDGKKVTGKTTYTFLDVDTDHTISVVFRYTGGSGPVIPSEPTLEGIAITSMPTRTDYSVGDAFDPTGMVIRATYSDGSTRDISSGYSFSPGLFAQAGNQMVTISYGGKTCTLEVSVTSDQGFSVIVTSYRGTMVDPTGNIVRFDDGDVPYDLSNLHARMEGIVPGIEQTLTLRVTNDGVTDLHAFVFVRDLECDGDALAEQVFLSSGAEANVSVLSANSETVTSENALLDLGVVPGGQSKEFEVTISFPSSDSNNDAMGERIGFKLGVFASEDSP